MTGLGLVAPWLLAAMGAAALPVIAHLVRHEDREGRGFPSLMFLRRVPFPSRARRRLSDRWLLALRLLALAALVLAFVGPHPLYDGAAAPAPRTDTVVLLDVSYSMAAGGRFERARSQARDALAAAARTGRVALLEFDTAVRTASDLGAGLAGAEGALNGLEPGVAGTDLARALGAAERALASSPALSRRVVLISDLQAVGLAGDARLERDVELELRPIGGALPGNLAVLGATWQPVGRSGGGRLAVQVGNTGGAPAAGALTVRVDGLEAGEHAIDLAPGERRELSLGLFVAEERAARVELALTPDAVAADDRRYLVLSVRPPLSLLLARAPGDVATGSGVHLDTALALARNPRVRVTRLDADRVDAERLRAAELVILDGATPATASARRDLADWVSGGGGLLAVAGGAAFAGLEPLAPSVGPRVESGAAGGAFAALAAGHPLSGVLDAERVAGIGVWRYRRLAPAADDRVLLRYDNGDAALVERAHGAGLSLTLGTALDPQWSALVLDPVFVPLLLESLWHLAGRGSVPVSVVPGSAVDVRAHAGAVAGGDALLRALASGETLRMRPPGGAERRVRADMPLVLDAVGVHELRAGEAAVPVAVSVDPIESRLDALSAEAFSTRVQRTAPAPRTRVARDAPVDTRWARVLLALAAVLLLVEGAVAARLAARRRLEAVAA